MNKSDKMLAFESIDIDLLSGSQKNKEISKLFITGMTCKAIGEIYGISASRVAQITSRQARIANGYKNRKNSPEYQALVESYMEKLKSIEIISISSDADVSEHTTALDEARTRLKKICDNHVFRNEQE